MDVESVDPPDADLLADGLGAGTVTGTVAASKLVEWDRSDAMIDEWGRQSFPASDPPSNW